MRANSPLSLCVEKKNTGHHTLLHETVAASGQVKAGSLWSLSVEGRLDDHAGGAVVRGEWPKDRGSGDPRGRRRRPNWPFDGDHVHGGRHRETQAARPPLARPAPVVALPVEVCSAIGLAAPAPPAPAAALGCCVMPTGSTVDLLRFLQHAQRSTLHTRESSGFF